MKDVRLVVTEKPSVAQSYAKALNVSVRKDGYIESDKYIITWCVGHLVELASVDVYDERYKNRTPLPVRKLTDGWANLETSGYKKWNIADLPIIPKKWEYVVSANKNTQFGVVKKLMNDSRVTEIVFATDAGREGELIARLVYEKAGCNKPVKRLWLSSMEEKAIINSFNNLKDGKEYDNLYQSALCRAKADFIVGINTTRVYTKLYNKKLNVGRVQTPTLALLCERGEAVKNFVKEKYYSVKLNDFAVSDKLKTESEAEKIKSECNGKTAVITSVLREKKVINPPKLFDLTSLQREANRDMSTLFCTI